MEIKITLAVIIWDNNMKKFYIITTAIFLILCSAELYSKAPLKKYPVTESKGQSTQRIIPTFDSRENTLSPIQCINSNDGKNLHNETKDSVSCTWPRGSVNSYVYGAGVWFGAKKTYNGTDYQLGEYMYNPSDGMTNMVPGIIKDGDYMLRTIKEKKPYQVYLSTEVLPTGLPVDDNELDFNWALWKPSGASGSRFGTYESDIKSRNTTKYPKGPVFISNEDIFAVYKDTDSLRFNGRQDSLLAMGWPLRMQWEERMYTFTDSVYKNMMIILFYGINTTTNTYKDCYLGYCADTDLKVIKGDTLSVKNDNVRFYNAEDSLNLAVAWTDYNGGEKDFAYLGISLLMTPAIDSKSNVRKDRELFFPEDQVPLSNAKFFALGEDDKFIKDIYGSLSQTVIEPKRGPDDIRLLLSAGPFNLAAGDTAKFAVMINFGKPVGAQCDGTDADMKNLIAEVKKGRKLFYEQKLKTDVETETATDKTLKVYPNPANDFIDLNIEKSDKCIIEIYNSMGVHVLSSTNQKRIAIGTLSSGIYYLRASLNDEYINTSFTIVR